MKLRKGSVADVLWFMTLVVVFIVIIKNSLEFSSTATIDSYAKNIVNSEATRFVSSIPGYAIREDEHNMYNSLGVKRSFGNENAPVYRDIGVPNDASANSLVNTAMYFLVENIREEFASHETLSTRTEDVKVYANLKDRSGKSTLAVITVEYTVVSSNVDGKSSGGLFGSSDMRIPRKAVAVRSVENHMRFR